MDQLHAAQQLQTMSKDLVGQSKFVANTDLLMLSSRGRALEFIALPEGVKLWRLLHN